jgi:thiamine pyrophosphokinase
LYYPLKNISLPFGIKESTSNLAVGNTVKLKIKSGIIFVIRDFKTAIMHDLF